MKKLDRSIFVTMNKETFFHDIYMGLASALAKRSHCIKKQVGAVIAKDTRVVSVGYNGPPTGRVNCDQKWPKKGCRRSLRGGGCFLAIHAEQNAILYALKNNINLAGATLYVTLSPCLACARLILGSGIQALYYRDSYAFFKGLPEEEGLLFLEYFGVHIQQYLPQ